MSREVEQFFVDFVKDKHKVLEYKIQNRKDRNKDAYNPDHLYTFHNFINNRAIRDSLRDLD